MDLEILKDIVQSLAPYLPVIAQSAVEEIGSKIPGTVINLKSLRCQALRIALF
jgi:hypothetical protein